MHNLYPVVGLVNSSFRKWTFSVSKVSLQDFGAWDLLLTRHVRKYRKTSLNLNVFNDGYSLSSQTVRIIFELHFSLAIGSRKKTWANRAGGSPLTTIYDLWGGLKYFRKPDLDSLENAPTCISRSSDCDDANKDWVGSSAENKRCLLPALYCSIRLDNSAAAWFSCWVLKTCCGNASGSKGSATAIALISIEVLTVLFLLQRPKKYSCLLSCQHWKRRSRITTSGLTDPSLSKLMELKVVISFGSSTSDKSDFVLSSSNLRESQEGSVQALHTASVFISRYK